MRASAEGRTCPLVLDYGKTISVGSPDEVQRDPAVIIAYLGTKRGSGAPPLQ